MEARLSSARRPLAVPRILKQSVQDLAWKPGEVPSMMNSCDCSGISMDVLLDFGGIYCTIVSWTYMNSYGFISNHGWSTDVKMMFTPSKLMVYLSVFHGF